MSDGKLTRDEMVAIINAGRSVMVGNEVVSNLADLSTALGGLTGDASFRLLWASVTAWYAETPGYSPYVTNFGFGALPPVEHGVAEVGLMRWAGYERYEEFMNGVSFNVNQNFLTIDEIAWIQNHPSYSINGRIYTTVGRPNYNTIYTAIKWPISASYTDLPIMQPIRLGGGNASVNGYQLAGWVITQAPSSAAPGITTRSYLTRPAEGKITIRAEMISAKTHENLIMYFGLNPDGTWTITPNPLPTNWHVSVEFITWQPNRPSGDRYRWDYGDAWYGNAWAWDYSQPYGWVEDDGEGGLTPFPIIDAKVNPTHLPPENGLPSLGQAWPEIPVVPVLWEAELGGVSDMGDLVTHGGAVVYDAAVITDAEDLPTQGQVDTDKNVDGAMVNYRAGSVDVGSNSGGSIVGVLFSAPMPNTEYSVTLQQTTTGFACSVTEKTLVGFTMSAPNGVTGIVDWFVTMPK